MRCPATGAACALSQAYEIVEDRNLRTKSRPRPWCCSLAISRWMTDGSTFSIAVSTDPRLPARVLPTRSEMVTTLIAQIVRFARPNIQIYDARVVDLYQWVCAQYLVGVKGAETKAKRSLARLSTEFQSGSRWLSKPYPAQKQSGGQPSKNKNLLYISGGWRRECQSIPIERSSIFDLHRPKPTVRATARKWNSAFDKSLSAPDDPSSTTLRRELASRIRGTEFIILSGVGHLSPLEAPSELATAIMKAVSHMR
jgi:hypothetical protein